MHVCVYVCVCVWEGGGGGRGVTCVCVCVCVCGRVGEGFRISKTRCWEDLGIRLCVYV